MVITDRFVFVHQPKTGGTFVASVLARIHEARLGDGWLARLRVRWVGCPGFADTRHQGTKHGTCNEIAPPHRHKPIVATVRNPYDRLVSRYEFRWWERHPKQDAEQIRRWYPSYPELTFEQFVDLGYNRMPAARQKIVSAGRVGPETRQFVHFFGRKPREMLSALDDGFIAGGGYREQLYPVRFLRTDRLNADLHGFLLETGYPPDAIAFILDAPKVLPGKRDGRKGRSWREYYTPELKALVRSREKLLFAMFPEFDV
jgi:hypothetical protein